MENNPLILTLNCTMQNAKAALIDKEGHLVAKAKASLPPYIHQVKGNVEQDPSVFWEKICHVSQTLRRNNPDLWDKIIGVTVTGMRDSFICLDEHGQPVRPAILWMDQRKASEHPNFTAMEKTMLRMKGQYDVAVGLYRQTKSNWIRENEPEVWDKTAHYLLVSGYLNYCMTNEFADSVASQVGYLPFDQRTNNWMTKRNIKSCIYNVDVQKLPRLVEVGEIIGRVTEEASRQTGIPQGLPLIATGSQKGCETLGAGCTRPDMANISFDSAATLQITTQTYIEPQQFIPTNPAVMPGYYNPETCVHRGYWMLAWLKEEIERHELERRGDELPNSLRDMLDQQLKNIEPGSEGLLLQPFFQAGRRVFHEDDKIIGFTEHHTAAHVYRAIIEGVNYSLIDGLTLVEKRTGFKVNRLVFSGAASQSRGICRITADMFGLPVYRPKNEETTALGAAIAAFVGLKVFCCYQDAIEAMVGYADCIQPTPDCSNRYRDLYYNVYKRISPKLKKQYQQMALEREKREQAKRKQA